MAEPATALLALWNDVEPTLDAVYNEWHAREHVPERLTVPGILWGRRYGRAAAARMPHYLTLYGLRDPAVLDGEPYQRLLREPTPASRRMRPALTNLSRWVCRLVEPGLLDEGSHLAVWTSAAEPADADRAAGRLVAERLPQAAALPWLQSGQTQPVEGDWLVCVPFEPVQAFGRPGPHGTAIYGRLPVG
jgi:hypothetical protein